MSLILGHGVLRHKWLDCDKTWSPGERASRMCSRSRSRARDLYDFTASVGLFNLGLILFCRPQLWRQCGRDFRKQKKTSLRGAAWMSVNWMCPFASIWINQTCVLSLVRDLPLDIDCTTSQQEAYVGKCCEKKLVFTMLLKTFEKSKFYFRFFVRFYTYYVI